MAVLKVARMGHPVLRQVAQPIADPTAPEVQTLLDDMVETMKDAEGTGLAAPQVHVSKRAIVYFIAKGRAGKDADGTPLPAVPLTFLLNPVITKLSQECVYDWEGCLSVPGLVGLVPRAARIRLKAYRPDGSEIDAVYAGFHARVLQHECDHLDGVLYPQRMDDLSLLMYREELRHGMPDKARALRAASNPHESDAAGRDEYSPKEDEG